MPAWGKEILSCRERRWLPFCPSGFVVASVGEARVLLLCRSWVMCPRQREQICLKIGQGHPPPQAWGGGGEQGTGERGSLAKLGQEE